MDQSIVVLTLLNVLTARCPPVLLLAAAELLGAVAQDIVKLSRVDTPSHTPSYNTIQNTQKTAHTVVNAQHVS